MPPPWWRATPCWRSVVGVRSAMAGNETLRFCGSGPRVCATAARHADTGGRAVTPCLLPGLFLRVRYRTESRHVQRDPDRISHVGLNLHCRTGDVDRGCRDGRRALDGTGRKAGRQHRGWHADSRDRQAVMRAPHRHGAGAAVPESIDQSRAAPTVSATAAPRSPKGFGAPSVVSRAV